MISPSAAPQGASAEILIAADYGDKISVTETTLAEPDQFHERTRKNIWFALGDSRPLAFFAGVWTAYSGPWRL